jgi:hypothetical protein
VAPGVQFPAVDGRRSTSDTGRAILAAAASGAGDAALAGRIAGARDWRSGYLGAMRDVTAAAAAGADAAVAMARAGLADARERLVFEDAAGGTVPLAAALARPPEGPALGAAHVDGRGAPVRRLELPYRGELLHGDALRRRLDAWVTEGVVEPAAAHAVARVDAHPEWLRLDGRVVVLLGAGAAMGPLAPLTAWGAEVIAVDVPVQAVRQQILAIARDGASRVTLPTAAGAEGDAERPGVDLAAELPRVSDWVERQIAGRPAILGTYTYADGAGHVRVNAAADAITARLLEAAPDTAVAALGTPTDCYVVEADVVRDARARWAARGVRGLAQAPLRRASGGRLFAPSYPDALPDGSGLADVLVPQQGPNYALAKRLQRWRVIAARAEGRRASFNVAPASWTRSVTRNRVLAAAYAGAHHFGVEVFRPETARVLMAALLVHDLHADTGEDRGPEARLTAAAVHGGLFRAAYEPRSVLGVAALAGIPRAVRPAP